MGFWGGMGSHKVTYWTRAWLLTSHLDEGGFGCPPQDAAKPSLGFFVLCMLKGLPLGAAEVAEKSQGGESGDLQRGFIRGLVRPAPNHHRPSQNLLEIHASLSLVLYSSFNLSFCSKVTQLQGLAPVGYSGAQLKICIAASCCQTRSSRANKNIHLSLVI